MEIVVTSRKLGNKVALIDDADFDLVKGYSWNLQRHKTKQLFYAQCTVYGGEKPITLMLHRVILNAPPGSIVDHKNGNGLDCRRENIRFCSHGENMANRKSFIKSSSKFLGVYFDKYAKKWRAEVRKNKKKLHRRYFDSEREAAEWYNHAAIIEHGEFARLNKL